MAKRPDANETAFDVVQRVLGATKPEKDPAAVSLGRRGGLKGGRARADSLTPEQKTELGKKGAAARWKKD